MSARQVPNTTLREEVLNLLSNVMFPVVVFLIWAAMTTIGTIVDQGQAEQHYYDTYPLPVANAVVRLHLTNIYNSVPYISLVVLLLLSMALFPNSITGAFEVYKHMVLGGPGLNILTPAKLLEIVAVFGGTMVVQYAIRRWPPRELIKNLDVSAVLRPAYAFGVATIALYFAVADAAVTSSPARFIYFQF